MTNRRGRRAPSGVLDRTPASSKFLSQKCMKRRRFRQPASMTKETARPPARMRPAATLCCGLPVESADEENASPTRRARTEQRSPRTFESTSSRPPRALEGTRRRDGLAACPSRLRPGNAPLKRTRAEPSGSPALSPFAPFEKSPPERRPRETPDFFTSVEKFNSQLQKNPTNPHRSLFTPLERRGNKRLHSTPPKDK